MNNTTNLTICNLTHQSLRKAITLHYGDRFDLLKPLDLISIIFAIYGCYRLSKPSWQNRPDRIHILGQFLATIGFHGCGFFMGIHMFLGSKATWSILNNVFLAAAAFRHHMQLSTIFAVLYNMKRLFRNDRTLVVELRLENDSGKLFNHPTELLSQFCAAGAISVASATVGSKDGEIRRWVSKDEHHLETTFDEAMRSLLALLVVCELLPLVLLTASTVISFVALWKLNTCRQKDSVNEDLLSERRRVSEIALKLSLVYVLKYLPFVGYYSVVAFYGNFTDMNACEMLQYVFGNGSKAYQRNIGPYSQQLGPVTGGGESVIIGRNFLTRHPQIVFGKLI